MRLNAIIKDIRSIKAFGNSMCPMLLEGDIVFLRKVTFSNIDVDDIICFRRGKKLITHKVIFKSKNYVITKGDNNAKSDAKVKISDILGRVYSVKRNGMLFNIDDTYLLQSSIYFDEIKRIVELFNLNRVEHVVLKGLPLHLFLEKKHPRRIYADCDILVAGKDIKKAKKVLKYEGYQSLDFSLSNEHRKLKHNVVEESFAKQINGFPVLFDIHYDANFMMTQLGKLEYLYSQKLLKKYTATLLNNKQGVEIKGVKFWLLSHEDQIIYLFLHLFHHNFKGGYRYDILVKILNSKYDTERLVKIITTYRLQNFIFAGLMLLQKHYPNKKYEEIIRVMDVSSKLKRTIEMKILPTKIFDDEDRIGGGVRRFMLLFYLSPSPITLKIFTFFDKQVLYSVFWVFIAKTRQSILIRFPFSRGLLQVIIQ